MNMTAKHLNCFIDATRETLSSMCGIQIHRSGELRKVDGEIVEADELMAIIGLAGNVKGAAMICCPVEIGLWMVSKFVMSEIKEINIDLMDGFGELVNIIAGAADAKFEDIRITLALPSILVGQNAKFFAKAGSPFVIVPFSTAEGGRFTLGVAMEILGKKT